MFLFFLFIDLFTWEHYLDSSWEVVYLQLEVELVIGLDLEAASIEAASIVASHSSASSSMGKV